MTKINTDSKKIDELLTRGVEEVIVKESVEKKLRSGKKLRIKFGIDPTGSDLHLGHAVPLRKLKQFQAAGHEVILLIGDYTAMIGDPSGRNETRPLLTIEQVKENMKTYLNQAKKIIDVDSIEVRYNSEWYGASNFMELFMELTGKIPVARILDRDDFQKRLEAGVDIRMQEILYPVLQGYDSVALKSDIEIGGTDQKFNLLMGRRIQRLYDQPEQDVMTVPLLVGTDGEKKMSKTYGNYIALLDTPEDVFGKVMRVPDSLIITYFKLATSISLSEINQFEDELKKGTNPRDIKLKLAEAVTSELHGAEAAKKGQQHFASVIQEKEIPNDIPNLKPTSYDIVTVLVEGKLVSSKAEARRAIEQGGVKVNEVKVDSIEAKVEKGSVVQKGKRFFVRIS